MHPSGTNFSVKTQSFEGPLELLLDLIEKRKLHISDVSLAQVADDFIAHIQKQEQFPVAESAHFILIASTLLLIKSKSLLPSLTLTEEEQSSIYDLETRLKLYERMRELSKHVKAAFGSQIMFGREYKFEIAPQFAPDPRMTLQGVHDAMKSLINRLPKHERLPQVTVRKIISLEEMITSLTDRITKNLKMSFREFSAHGKAEKVNVIVGFLAMLELVKQGMIHVRQEKEFDDIHMESQTVGIPRY
jgi:segregation and condensation protein A